jgi:hypothetical protein|tara:strand:+ start:1598 stop:1720 length:123 start_codon:yes stop_codon:yes gene_type:complete
MLPAIKLIVVVLLYKHSIQNLESEEEDYVLLPKIAEEIEP